MTIDQLLDWPDPATLTDAEIDAALAPYFPLTRPRDLSPTSTTALPPEVAARVKALQAGMSGGAASLLNKLRTKS